MLSQEREDKKKKSDDTIDSIKHLFSLKAIATHTKYQDLDSLLASDKLYTQAEPYERLVAFEEY